MKNTFKYLLVGNVLSIIKRGIFVSAKYKAEGEPFIFHTYIKVKFELKK